MFHFDRETSLTPDGSNGYRGEVSGQWNIGANPNGGYLLALTLRGLAAVLPHPDPVTLTAHFLRPGTAGSPCEVRVELVRSGRSMSTGRATLSQDGKPRLQLLASFGDLTQAVGVPDSIATLPDPGLPEPDACPQRSGASQGLDLPILSRLDTRLHPGQALAGQAKDAVVSGWIRCVDQRPPCTLLLPVFADAFPPSAFGLLGAVGWVPTMELTVHVRRRPQPGWVKALFRTNDLQQGRMIEDGLLWDSAGHLVAQSRQIGLVMAAD